MRKTQFTVSGKSATKGSWRPIPNPKTGKTLLIPQGGRSKVWEREVKDAARIAHDGDPWPKGTPVALYVIFYFNRPNWHFRTKAGKVDRSALKPSAPKYPCGAIGDLDKLVRAIGDALTGVVYGDDCQIVSILAYKVYHGDGEVWVVAEELANENT